MSRIRLLLAFTTMLAVLVLCGLPQAAQAQDERCLKISFPAAIQDEVRIQIYQDIMRSHGLCVEAIHMPNARAILSMKADEIDGVFAVLDEFAEQVGIPVVRGGVQVGNPEGLLVVRDDTVSGLSDLTSQSIGIWLGASWSERLLADYPHTVRCPGGPEMMGEMLTHGRIDGMLINSYSLGMMGGVPDGYVAIPVRKLHVHSWLNARYADLLAQFDAGTAQFRQKIVEWRQQAN